MKKKPVRMTRYGEAVHTIFDLVGHQENDITSAIGWSLSSCREFLQGFLSACGVPPHGAESMELIDLQRHGTDGGFTDIEMTTDRFHLILEAKCGWNLPTQAQLEKYAGRFKCAAKNAVLVIVSECTEEFVTVHHLRPRVSGCRVVYLSYRELLALAQQAHGCCRDASRRVLSDLQEYLGEIMASNIRQSNLVYVVALAGDTPPFSTVSWIDIVEKFHRYFHPVGGNGWPAEPVGYIGFRYHGRLQCIRYVKDYVVVPDGRAMHAELPPISARKWDKSPFVYHGGHFVYRLGPPVRPNGIVKSGNIRAMRLWAAIDLLLTCKSVPEAAKLTKLRQ